MNEIVLREVDKRGFEKLFGHCKKWSAEHQAEIGVAEMALGVAAIAWGVQSGQIQFGKELVATEFSDGGLMGAAAGAGISGIGTSVLVSMGVSVLSSIGLVSGAAFSLGVPVLLLASGGMLILGAAGYGVGDVAQKLLTPHFGFGDVLAGASILTVGVALIIDGARRVVKDERVLQMASKFKDGVIQLAPLTTKIVARTKEEFESIINELSKNPAASITSGTTAVAGAAIGGALAAGSVTVLGSHGLGAVALSLGLVSAPVWPVIAGGAVGLALGAAAWKGIKHYRDNPRVIAGGDSGHGGLLQNPNEGPTKGD